MAGASAYTRVLEPSGAVCKGLPHLAGASGARLVLKSDGEPAGPPAGARRYTARWHRGKTSGEADVLVMPLASWGSEVHVAVRSPATPAGLLLWRGRRLSRLAAHLATAIRDASRPEQLRRSATRELVAASWRSAQAAPRTSAAR